MKAAQLQAVRAMFRAASEPMRRTHRYDNHGRRIKSRLQFSLLGGEVGTMVYNNYGEQIAKICLHEQRECAIGLPPISKMLEYG